MSLAPHEIVQVGVALGLNYNHLQNMNQNDLLNEMINAWLRRDDNVIQASGTPTWQSLVKALESLHFSGVASEIRKDRYVAFMFCGDVLLKFLSTG